MDSTLSRRHINLAHAAALVELSAVSREWERLGERRQELIDQCIAAGHSERAIGTAARVTGAAIHQRKEKARV